MSIYENPEQEGTSAPGRSQDSIRGGVSSRNVAAEARQCDLSPRWKQQRGQLP